VPLRSLRSLRVADVFEQTTAAAAGKASHRSAPAAIPVTHSLPILMLLRSM
jgi:hypothetical protein